MVRVQARSAKHDRSRMRTSFQSMRICKQSERRNEDDGCVRTRTVESAHSHVELKAAATEIFVQEVSVLELWELSQQQFCEKRSIGNFPVPKIIAS